MRSLSLGYFLSAINALVFFFPNILFFPVLATYPVSIVLRGLGWRSLKGRLGPLGLLYNAIWSLGALTYLALILSLLEIFRDGIWVALVAWAVYSVLEAILYLKAAAKLGTRLFYASPVSLVGVGSIVASVLMVLDQFKLPSGVKYGDSLLFFGGAACLVASALITAVAALQIRAGKPAGERELKSLLVTKPRYSSTTSPQLSRPTQPTARPRETLTVRPSRTPLISLEVLSRSDTLVCLKCGASAPIGVESCPRCGERFKKASSGLRCPVCGAPFSIAKPISAGHYICGQCFSDIRVISRTS